MKQVNQYLPSPSQPPIDPAKVLIGIILLLAFCAILKSCSVARKDSKAVERVISKADLQDIVANEYFKRNPPLIITVKKDSIVTQHDTIVAEKKVVIPRIVSINRNIDTIIDNISILINDSVIVVKCLDGVKTVTKTITKIQFDERLAQRLTDSLSKKDKELSYQKGQAASSKESNHELKKTNTKYFWYLIAASALLSVSAFYNAKQALTRIPKITLPKFN